MTARPVVAATDGTEDSLRAVEWAAKEAVLRGVPLRIVSAASLPKMVLLPLKPERDAVLDFVRDYRDRALAAAANRAAEIAPGLLIDTDPVEGPPAPTVTGSGPGALMLVTGSHGIGAFTAMVLGSVARYAADHARCPVVVVRGETAAVHQLVGVGLGDLDNCADTLAFAFEEAALRKAELLAIHAWHAPQDGIFWAGHRFPPPGLHVAAAHAARQLTLLLDGWREKYPDVPVSTNVVHGHPGRALVGLSARADIVVIGRHTSQPGLPGPGSVRHAVLSHAHGPIAVVPSPSACSQVPLGPPYPRVDGRSGTEGPADGDLGTFLPRRRLSSLRIEEGCTWLLACRGEPAPVSESRDGRPCPARPVQLFRPPWGRGGRRVVSSR
jgi:nucleotide-binding universal stress UspA family protein